MAWPSPQTTPPWTWFSKLTGSMTLPTSAATQTLSILMPASVMVTSTISATAVPKDSTNATPRPFPLPSGPFQSAISPTRFQQLAVDRNLAHLDARLQRIEPRGVDQFVDEALGEEAVGRGADRPPGRGRRQSLHLIACRPVIRDVVVHVPDADGQLAIGILRGRAHALASSPLKGAVAATCKSAATIFPSLTLPLYLPIAICRGISCRKSSFAREDELHRRSAHLVRDLGKRPDVLEFEAVPEASTRSTHCERSPVRASCRSLSPRCTARIAASDGRPRFPSPCRYTMPMPFSGSSG